MLPPWFYSERKRNITKFGNEIDEEIILYIYDNDKKITPEEWDELYKKHYDMIAFQIMMTRSESIPEYLLLSHLKTIKEVHVSVCDEILKRNFKEKKYIKPCIENLIAKASNEITVCINAEINNQELLEKKVTNFYKQEKEITEEMCEWIVKTDKITTPNKFMLRNLREDVVIDVLNSYELDTSQLSYIASNTRFSEETREMAFETDYDFTQITNVTPKMAELMIPAFVECMEYSMDKIKRGKINDLKGMILNMTHIKPYSIVAPYEMQLYEITKEALKYTNFNHITRFGVYQTENYFEKLLRYIGRNTKNKTLQKKIFEDKKERALIYNHHLAQEVADEMYMKAVRHIISFNGEKIPLSDNKKETDFLCNNQVSNDLFKKIIKRKVMQPEDIEKMFTNPNLSIENRNLLLKSYDRKKRMVYYLGIFFDEIPFELKMEDKCKMLEKTISFAKFPKKKRRYYGLGYVYDKIVFSLTEDNQKIFIDTLNKIKEKVRFIDKKLWEDYVFVYKEKLSHYKYEQENKDYFVYNQYKEEFQFTEDFFYHKLPYINDNELLNLLINLSHTTIRSISTIVNENLYKQPLFSYTAFQKEGFNDADIYIIRRNLKKIRSVLNTINTLKPTIQN